MAKGKKTGGRQLGTPNRISSTVVELIDKLAGPGAELCFQQLANIAFQPHPDIKSRLLANKALIEWRHGRPREQVELAHSGEIHLPTQVIFELHRN